MEEPEMVALKKAYAEIILNTAKEAASRVMESDRQAVRFQRDLVRTQYEAVRMLIRMKQMMDSKTSEAKKISMSQRKRIEELEAQLQEAEDKIVDVRMDLQKAEDELEKLKKNQVQPCHKQQSKQNVFSPKDETDEKILSPLEPMVPYSSDSDLETTAPYNVEDDRSNEKDSCLKSCNVTKQNEMSTYLKSYCNRASSLGSEMMSAEPELYNNNNCAHKLSSRGGQSQLEKHITMDSESLLSTNQPNIKASGFLLPKANILRKQVRSGEEVKKPVKFRTMRRKGRSRRIQACSRRSSSMQLVKCSRTSVPPPNKLGSANRSAELQCIPDECFKFKRKARRKRNGNAYTSNQMDVQLQQPNQIRSEPNSTDHAEIQSMPDLDPQSVLGKANENCWSTEKVPNAHKPEVRDDLLVNPEADTTESLMLQNCEPGTETSKFSGVNPDRDDAKSSKENKGFTRTNDSRLLKYTFQRKRKKEPFACTNENGLPEKSDTTRKEAGDTEEGEQREPKKPALLNESFRDNQGLAQVARQLIALSGKRWW